MATAEEILKVRENIGDTSTPYRVTDVRLNEEIDSGGTTAATIIGLRLILSKLITELRENESDRESEQYQALKDQVEAVKCLIKEYSEDEENAAGETAGFIVKSKKPTVWGAC
jgi:hypothetical protein